jgi:tRNA 5-methylaminomethyl-2-thiouridine biosynthesis bifunctional protein
VVVGAGLSGSAVAYSLACRGWQVTVIDQGDAIGAGASGLPAGLAAPHVSPDDSVLSRITRAGVRSTLQRAAACLHEGHDWALSGVLEHRVEGKRSLPQGQAWPAAAHQWSTPASPASLAQAGLPADTSGLWHGLAGWIRPRQLVAAQLQAPGIQTLWQQTVARIECVPSTTAAAPALWQVLNAEGKALATAPLVILASAFNSHDLLHSLCGPDEKAPIPLNPLRGQISYGLMQDLPADLRQQLPPFPVNGHGSFISGVPTAQGESGWFIGSTFERQCTQAPLRNEDHAANQQRLATLLPALGAAMRSQFDPGQIQGWAGLRCTLPDRLPALGPVHTTRWPGLWITAGMGARGISLAVMCGEICAALLENEPLPLAPSLARHLMAERFASIAL